MSYIWIVANVFSLPPPYPYLASINADGDRYVESNENTRAAIDELNEVLRLIFPMVPRKSHLIWSSRHHGILIDQPLEQQLISSQVEHKSRNFHFMPEKTDDYEEKDSLRPKSTLLNDLTHGPSSKLSQPTASDRAHRPPSAVLVSPKDVTTSADDVLEMLPEAPSTSSGSHRPKEIQKVFHLVLHQLKNNLEASRSPSKPELTTPSLGKRGPECMRRCILQGLLHPVQCHSLC